MAGVIGSGLEGYLHRQARERALNRLAEAQEQADALLDQTKAEVEAERSAVQQRLARAAIEQRTQARAQARLTALQTRANRREELVRRLWEEVEERLRHVAQREPGVRRALLERLLADAAEQLGGGPLTLQTNPQDAALLDDDTLAEWLERMRPSQGVLSLARSDEPADVVGGLIAYRTDSNRLVDNSLDERLDLTKRLLRDEVFGVLEGSAQTHPTPATPEERR